MRINLKKNLNQSSHETWQYHDLSLLFPFFKKWENSGKGLCDPRCGTDSGSSPVYIGPIILGRLVHSELVLLLCWALVDTEHMTIFCCLSISQNWYTLSIQAAALALFYSLQVRLNRIVDVHIADAVVPTVSSTWGSAVQKQQLFVHTLPLWAEKGNGWSGGRRKLLALFFLPGSCPPPQPFSRLPGTAWLLYFKPKLLVL